MARCLDKVVTQRGTAQLWVCPCHDRVWQNPCCSELSQPRSRNRSTSQAPTVQFLQQSSVQHINTLRGRQGSNTVVHCVGSTVIQYFIVISRFSFTALVTLQSENYYTHENLARSTRFHILYTAYSGQQTVLTASRIPNCAQWWCTSTKSKYYIVWHPWYLVIRTVVVSPAILVMAPGYDRGLM